MPLMSKNLLETSVKSRSNQVDPQLLRDLQEFLKMALHRIDTNQFKKEESEKVPFLQKLFELLGYKHNTNLEFEYTTCGRSIDGVLGNADPNSSLLEKGKRRVEVAIEWKGIDTRSLDGGKAGETPVSQMWDYMGKVGAEIGIVGNFLEWRLYTLKTKQSNFQSFSLRELTQNENKLIELIFLFGPSTLLRTNAKTCLLEDLINQSEAQQEQITKRFYSDYKQTRLSLFNHLISNNPNSDKIILLEKSQKVLDRLIFIMFCEDSYLLPSKLIRQTFELGTNNRSRSETKVWEQFQYIFEDIDVGRYDINPRINAFNGGLFASDQELNGLMIKDDIWTELIRLAEYDFASDLNVNILGHIFEQSIGDIEEIKASLENPQNSANLDPLQGINKKSKRKKDGIYYTPEYITDYIVSQTVGAWLGESELTLKSCISIDLPASKLLKKIVELSISIGEEAIGDPNEQPITMGLNLKVYLENYLNTWYLFNNLELNALKDVKFDSEISQAFYNLEGNSHFSAYYKVIRAIVLLLVEICEITGIQSNCFELIEYFENRLPKRDLDSITILDPAGGSGAFPNQVHSYLAKKQAQKANQIAIDAGLGNLAQLDENQIDKSILKNNIFMVDLQPESVEIAKLSLWLKTARKDQKLNNLDQNVKCGNSLIDDPLIAGDAAFDWNKEFPDILNSSKKIPDSSLEETPKVFDFDPLKGVRAAYDNKFTEIGFTFPSNKSLKDRAREMAKNMTKAEQQVWFNILESNQTGFKWIKQKVIDNYIVDFYCHTLGLVIEIDGDTHTERKEYDDMRTQLLNNFGLEVIRYSNTEVYQNLEGVGNSLNQIISLRQTDLIKQQNVTYSEYDKTPVAYSDTPLEGGSMEGSLPLLRGQSSQNFGGLTSQNQNNVGGFKVILGNPPYVNIANITDEKIRKYYQTHYKTVKNKSDLYSIFIEKGINLLNNGGYLGYIISNSWLGTDSFRNLESF